MNAGEPRTCFRNDFQSTALCLPSHLPPDNSASAGLRLSGEMSFAFLSLCLSRTYNPEPREMALKSLINTNQQQMLLKMERVTPTYVYPTSNASSTPITQVRSRLKTA